MRIQAKMRGDAARGSELNAARAQHAVRLAAFRSVEAEVEAANPNPNRNPNPNPNPNPNRNPNPNSNPNPNPNPNQAPTTRTFSCGSRCAIGPM